MSRLPAALLLTAVCLPALAADGGSVPPTAVDQRIEIIVSARERNQMLYEMRTFLHGLHNIHHALSRQDLKSVAIEARPLGQVLNRMPPGMRDRVPTAFLEMSNAQHEVFDVIARDAETKADISLTLRQLAEAMTYCSGCHDTYRFQVGTVKER